MEKGNQDEGNPVIGSYKNGDPIHRHPSKQEIQDHLDEWMGLFQQNSSREQREVMENLRDSQINKQFVHICKVKRYGDEQVIQLAIKWWAEQWPWEVKPFFQDIEVIKAKLHNEKAYAADKRASMIFYGRIPERVKSFCLAHRQDFWARDIKGKNKNLELFYKLCPKAKISSYRGSA